MKIFTTLAIIATFGLVWGCSSEDSTGGSDAGTGATGGGGTGATGGMAGMGAMGGMGATGGGGTGATGGAAGGGGTGGGSACGTCMQANCATEFGACTANADCMAIFTCAQTNNCTDQACVDSCITANPNGKTAFDAVYACVSQNCATECGG